MKIAERFRVSSRRYEFTSCHVYMMTNHELMTMYDMGDSVFGTP